MKYTHIFSLLTEIDGTATPGFIISAGWPIFPASGLGMRPPVCHAFLHRSYILSLDNSLNIYTLASPCLVMSAILVGIKSPIKFYEKTIILYCIVVIYEPLQKRR